MTKLWALLLVFVCAGCAAASSEPRAADREPVAHSGVQLAERGRSYAAVGDDVRAEQYFAAALDAGADSERVLPELLAVLVRSGGLRSALEYAEPRLREAPRDVQLRYLVATLYLALELNEQGLGELRRLLELEPGHPEALFLAGAESLRAGNQAATQRYFAAYLRSAPEGSHAPEVEDWLRRERLVRSSSRGRVP